MLYLSFLPVLIFGISFVAASSLSKKAASILCPPTLSLFFFSSSAGIRFTTKNRMIAITKRTIGITGGIWQNGIRQSRIKAAATTEMQTLASIVLNRVTSVLISERFYHKTGKSTTIKNRFRHPRRFAAKNSDKRLLHSSSIMPPTYGMAPFISLGSSAFDMQQPASLSYAPNASAPIL